MLRKIRLNYPSERVVQVGDLVQKDGKNMVIINILRAFPLLITTPESQRIIYECLAQVYGTPDYSQDYMETTTTLEYNLCDFGRNVLQVGDIVKDDSTGIWVQVNEISEIRRQENKYAVTYSFIPVNEWSQADMIACLAQSAGSYMKVYKKED